MIYLDMDGVLVDFMQGVHNKYGWKLNPYPYPLGEWDIVRYLPMSEKKFWSNLKFQFWAGLPWTKDGKEIYEICKNNCVLMTTPCLTRGCMDGKREWVKKNIPEMYNKIVFTTCKHKLAHKDVILVDDRAVNIAHFIQAGGKGCLVPRLWNHEHRNSNRAIEFVEAIVKGI